MTQEEAEKIARIVSTADGGCPTCIARLISRLNGAGLGWTFHRVSGEWTERPADDLEDDGRSYPLISATLSS